MKMFDYKKLKNINKVFYFHKESSQIHVLDLSDRKTLDENGFPWWRGAFGNCLIALKSGFTDKLLLMTVMDVEKLNEYSTAKKLATVPAIEQATIIENTASNIITTKDI